MSIPAQRFMLTQTGFFPENLLQMYPVVPASYFDAEAALSFYTNFTGYSYIKNGKLLGYASYLIFIFLSDCEFSHFLKYY